ncbi:MAG: TIGR01459 family HAD-type hydrolase, partial [Rhodobacteraceae bacterium]|nr:TIGR01459 family HAD-type hydrolase [Paracoccaceae bacterium]
MTQEIASLTDIAGNYDALVFDQWGVLHNGSTPYDAAVSTLEHLSRAGHRLAVLSNSGKRAAPNAARIATFGFDQTWFNEVMTSGEALWRDIAAGHIPHRNLYAVERTPGDALAWAQGLSINLVERLDQAEAILLMGLPDGTEMADWHPFIAQAAAANMPVYCSNPDRASPRAGGQLVVSPGELAYRLRDAGTPVTFYGKPHPAIFKALQSALNASRLLIVGDSLEHDIAGGCQAGWDTVLVQGGLYAVPFATDSPARTVLSALAA